MKYLKGFKWRHLTEKLAYERRVREQKLRVEMMQAKKENAAFAQLVEKKKELGGMEARKREKKEREKEKEKEGGGASGGGGGGKGKKRKRDEEEREEFRVVRRFRQVAPLVEGGGGGGAGGKGGKKGKKNKGPALDKELLKAVFQQPQAAGV